VAEEDLALKSVGSLVEELGHGPTRSVRKLRKPVPCGLADSAPIVVLIRVESAAQ
jgi:hypothetical protein